MNILVVDDSAAMRMIVKKNLKALGVDNSEIKEAADGALAYEMIEKSVPDLVVSDWNMPNMTGLQLLEKLNQEEIKVKLGFVTTEASTEMREKATDAGARFMITKPFTEDSFKNGIGKYLN